MNHRSRHHGFGVVLLLVLMSASLQVASPNSDAARLLTMVLGAAILVMSVWAGSVERRGMRLAALLALLCVAGSLVVLLVTGDVPDGAAALVNGLLILFAPFVIATALLRDVRAEGSVSVRTLSGVLAIYVLLGMFWSFVFAAVGALQDGPFFAQIDSADRSDYLYFSYITLATVGYGDLTALTDVGRMCAVAEALIGQIYLVTVVALIVSRLRPQQRQGRPETPPG